MSIKKNNIENKNSWDIWIKVIPIALTAIGLAFGAYQWHHSTKKTESEKKTWEQKKVTYNGLLSTIGKIVAYKGNDSLLKVYSLEFDEYYFAKMKQAEGNDSLLIFQMMMMKKDIQNSIRHKGDFYQNDKLGKTCKKLSDQISEAIIKGDEQF